ncbi:MAG: hypothetical protein EWV75_12960 [Microcystis wesenbergii Mw_QC_S_20081001_S30D]|uniref:Uncharacterized protein n=1 Tax=Microcystis wesenbergii Mw_QC_S_20081001_S30D TaxID=2486245 RepID=A0A552JJ93_9CHRO|nr:MAG: hypothetical protein EWV75_12960 [Microcystis wesenbergii Mw_QC_S_20081001_S30D]TRV00980.1 MAG: hypothetical protein EWV73_10050 [Microcystis wesenbergii Mw_QC_B_20070930_S4D]TRV06060.1 MAG: hypothetical protein EWV74_01495 [Microcystis wesenbergii Mw_QC_S_20081001_S30]TRV12647.1 MAG: hypothetical protein EWV89_12865 [Microcystis wesenbergii Mw_QC_B_20070930_S4]
MLAGETDQDSGVSPDEKIFTTRDERGFLPHTLHPTPYTLHPTPYTLHPTPYTLHPLNRI